MIGEGVGPFSGIYNCVEGVKNGRGQVKTFRGKNIWGIKHFE
jgi:hypothetical protein